MRVRVRLQPWQTRQLQTYKDRVQAAAQLGSPGMLVAQICWDNADQKWWIEPCFLPHELAKLVTEKATP